MHSAQSLALIADSDVMRSILSRVDTIAASDSSVLLIGETSVGRELTAEYIHRTSRRNTKPFVRVGLSALPPELLESELFGHERGAYTSASSEKKGLFELAAGSFACLLLAFRTVYHQSTSVVLLKAALLTYLCFWVLWVYRLILFLTCFMFS